MSNEQYAEAIKPYHLKAKKLEIGVTLAKNIATIQRIREPTQTTNIQERVMRPLLKTSKSVTADVTKLAGKQAIHEARIHGLSETIFGLEKQLRDRPVVIEQKFGFDLGLPSFDKLKGPLLIAGIAIGGLFLAGKFLGRKQ